MAPSGTVEVCRGPAGGRASRRQRRRGVCTLRVSELGVTMTLRRQKKCFSANLLRRNLTRKANFPPADRHSQPRAVPILACACEHGAFKSCPPAKC